MAINITRTDATDQPAPIVAPIGQLRERTDATAGLIMLNAVNRILEGIGEMPVTALNPGTDALAGDAQRILEETTTEILMDRWHCNTLATKTFTAGSDGRVALSGVLSFGSAIGSEGRYAMVEGYLYDRDSATFAIGVGATVTLADVVLAIDFADLAEPLRRYATTRAAERFANTKQGDKEQVRYLSSIAEQARHAALRFDGDQRQVNLIANNYDSLRINGTILRQY